MTTDQMRDTVDQLVAQGWTFEAWQYEPTCKGWWMLKSAEPGDVRGMRRGDPKPFYAGAVAVAELYLAEVAL